MARLYKLGGVFRVGEFTADVGALAGVSGVWIEQPLGDKSLEDDEFLALDQLEVTFVDSAPVTFVPGDGGYSA